MPARADHTALRRRLLRLSVRLWWHPYTMGILLPSFCTANAW
ncbi:hypothetical protein [Streptomyces flaveolus]